MMDFITRARFGYAGKQVREASMPTHPVLGPPKRPANAGGPAVRTVSSFCLCLPGSERANW
jgi:hypothetical protein